MTRIMTPGAALAFALAALLPGPAWSAMVPTLGQSGAAVEAGKEITSYAIFSGDSITLSGNSDEKRQAEALQNKVHGDFIWFIRDHKAYYLTDPGTLERARGLLRPQIELALEKSRLSEQKSRLSDEKSKLSQEKSTITDKTRSQIDGLRKQMETLRKQFEDSRGQAEQAKGSAAAQSRIVELQARIDELQRGLNEQTSQLGERQAKLNEQQDALGQQQARIGEQQSKLAADASAKLRALLEDAWRDSLAKSAE